MSTMSKTTAQISKQDVLLYLQRMAELRPEVYVQGRGMMVKLYNNPLGGEREQRQLDKHLEVLRKQGLVEKIEVYNEVFFSHAYRLSRAGLSNLPSE